MLTRIAAVRQFVSCACPACMPRTTALMPIMPRAANTVYVTNAALLATCVSPVCSQRGVRLPRWQAFCGNKWHTLKRSPTLISSTAPKRRCVCAAHPTNRLCVCVCVRMCVCACVLFYAAWRCVRMPLSRADICTSVTLRVRVRVRMCLCLCGFVYCYMACLFVLSYHAAFFACLLNARPLPLPHCQSLAHVPH